MGDERGPKFSLKGIGAGGRVDYQWTTRPSVSLQTNYLPQLAVFVDMLATQLHTYSCLG